MKVLIIVDIVWNMEDNGLIPIICSAEEEYSLDAPPFPIKENQQYRVTIKVLGKRGLKYSAYLSVALFDSKNRERKRYIRWLNDFSGNNTEVTVTFTSPPESTKAIIGYRINAETPVRSNIEIELTKPLLISLTEVSGFVNDYDDIKAYEVPQLPSLTPIQENQLEKRIIWIFGAPRSGTTWLGPRLLEHPPNIVWNEPWIGFHIAGITTREDLDGDRPIFERLLDTRANEHRYFFSSNYRNIWLPALRKFILTRAYAHVQTVNKNIIIKEPAGAYAADIIMECLPNSKMIFLLRDGRDVVESRMDNEMKTWSKLSSEVIIEKRYRTIQFYSIMWNTIIKSIFAAYNKQRPELRLLVKYEELKANTFAEMQRIYKFLKVEISEEELRKRIESYDFKNIPESEKGPGKFNRAASTGAWRNTFSKREQDLMNSIMGENLTEFGYTL